MKKTIVVILLIVSFITVSYKCNRWHKYKSIVNNSSYQRLCSVPQRIDTNEISILRGNYFSIGHASFMLSTTNPVPLTEYSSSKMWVKGSDDNFDFVFCPPYDATQIDDNELSKELDKFTHLNVPLCSLLFQEKIEEFVPIDFVSSLFITRKKFHENIICLTQKSNTYYGYSGVYVIENQPMRFLVLLGAPTSSFEAFVIAENASGTQTMNMIFSSNNDDMFLQNIFSFLLSFNFTADNLCDENESAVDDLQLDNSPYNHHIY